MSTAAAGTGARARAGVVSVVTINYKGAEDTIACLSALGELDWPAERVQVLCVDNASEDGSIERIRAAAPEVELIASPTNTGFSGGCSLGVAHATGEYIAFLNNDAKPDPRWLAEAVAVLEADPTIACVACKILNWDGSLIDFVDGGLFWTGNGFQRDFRQPDEGQWDDARDMLFACGGAMVVRADVYRSTGGFDDRYFMFFEDVDFGWRLNLLGHRVRYVPTSVVYHRHHGSIGKTADWYLRFLCERNALMSMYKNFSDETLAQCFAPAIALTVRRGFFEGADDTSVLDLRHGKAEDDRETLEVSKVGMTGAFAVDSMFAQIDDLAHTRADLQRRRVRSDRDLVPLFRDPVPFSQLFGSHRETYEALVAAFGIHDLFTLDPPTEDDPEVIPPGTAPADVLALYRAAAADRIRRNSLLVEELRTARRAAVDAERKLTRALKRVKQLEAGTPSAKTGTGKATSGQAASEPTPATAAAARRARRVARAVLRRVRATNAARDRTEAGG
ncbi:MAG TPA: glycosyltransferase family 2 protein [Sporichthyaceae bacterium]|jgi:hypothetical protein